MGANNSIEYVISGEGYQEYKFALSQVESKTPWRRGLLIRPQDKRLCKLRVVDVIDPSIEGEINPASYDFRISRMEHLSDGEYRETIVFLKKENQEKPNPEKPKETSSDKTKEEYDAFKDGFDDQEENTSQ